VACICAVAFREGNNIYGVYACEDGKPPLAIRYLVNLASPAEMTLSVSANKYTVGLITNYDYWKILRIW